MNLFKFKDLLLVKLTCIFKLTNKMKDTDKKQQKVGLMLRDLKFSQVDCAIYGYTVTYTAVKMLLSLKSKMCFNS